MVGEELHRHDQDIGHTVGGERWKEVDEIGAKPLLGGVARALVRERPALDAGFARDSARGLAELLDVRGLRSRCVVFGVMSRPRRVPSALSGLAEEP